MSEENDDVEVAVAPNHIEKMRERMGAAKSERVDPEEETDTVVVQDPDDDDELEPEVPKTRDERRAARRKQTLREEKAAAEARAEVYKQELDALKARTPATPAPVQNASAHLDRQYLDVEKEQERLITEYRRLEREEKITPELDAEYRGKARVLEIRRTALVMDMKAAHDAPQRARDAQLAELQRRNPDVWGSPAALRYAEGEYNKRIARGEPDTLETHDAAAQEARQVILGKRPPPDDAARSRATGMSGGARGAPARGAPVALAMPVGSRMYQLACARYPELEPKQACQKWANTSGKAFLESQRSRG